MELPIGFIPTLVALEQSLSLGSLAGLHPLGHNVGESPLANHLQDVLTVKLPVHQHVIDVNQVLGRIKQVLYHLFA